ncbi:MAG TPA: GNAT family protein [Tepidisphaeraceae bacterium]|nr:GNAT family protein [Tepidisphaeraceae bacterium]
MFDPGDLTLQHGEVLLRPLTHSDAPALAEAAEGLRGQTLFTTVPDAADAGRAYVDHALAMRSAGTRFPMVIIWQARVVGSTSYMRYQPWEWPLGSQRQRANRPDIVEIGYTWLAASAQRTACNTTAKLALLTHAFESWQVHAVLLRTDARNRQSRTAIARLGAKLDGVLRADMPSSDNLVRSTAQYSILASEWAAVRASLQRRLSPVGRD